LLEGPIINGAATVVVEDPNGIQIPANAPLWVSEAVKHLEGGWRVRDLEKHLRKHRKDIYMAFKKFGLPAPSEIHRAARSRRFQHLLEEGYGDDEIATMTGVTAATVWGWRTCTEHDMPHTDKSSKTIQKQRVADSTDARHRHKTQLKLL
jgi:hypothetical protein